MRGRIVFSTNGVETTNYPHGKQNETPLPSHHTQKLALNES